MVKSRSSGFLRLFMATEGKGNSIAGGADKCVDIRAAFLALQILMMGSLATRWYWDISADIAIMITHSTIPSVYLLMA